MEILGQEWMGNSVEAWLVAILVTVLSYAGLWLLVKFVTRRLDKLAVRTHTTIDDRIAELLHKTHWWLLAIAALFIGSLSLQLPARVQAALESVTVIALLIQSGIWANALLGTALQQYLQRQLEKDPGKATALNALGFLARLLLWSAIVLLVLDNLGINITTLIAGLGIGGIAIALAVQNILGDLFSSLSIMLDKPFTVGDFLIIDEYLGSVEHIGLKTTRVRSLSGEQLVFSNSDLLNSRIRNYGRMFERRVVFSIGVTYQTQRDKLRLIPAILREAVEAQENTRFDRAHFKEYGAFSLNYETVYYVLVPDYNAYMDTQQAINFHIHERFEQEGIEFAYPTQTLFVKALD